MATRWQYEHTIAPVTDVHLLATQVNKSDGIFYFPPLKLTLIRDFFFFSGQDTIKSIYLKNFPPFYYCNNGGILSTWLAQKFYFETWLKTQEWLLI